jgi:hypothetical protein
VCGSYHLFQEHGSRAVAGGRYLERESAAGGEIGFDGHQTGVEISARLQGWQAQKDELLWKLIISPEFGDRVDLQRLTRDVMNRMEEDLGGTLEWVAVVHRNTEHPHVHVSLRGANSLGSTLRLKRDYVKRGVREIAESLCTRQLGYRTSLDASEASRREIDENRFTSLDRLIFRQAHGCETGLVFTPTPTTNAHVGARLCVLARMGLAERASDGAWLLRPDSEQILRAMQRAADRQKTLFAHGESISDRRLPIQAIDWRQTPSVEGRVLVHGEQEHTDKRFLMLESTSARVFYIPYTREMDDVRARGGLRANSFVRLKCLETAMRVEDLGDSEKALSNSPLLRKKVEELRKRGFEPTEDGWGGWLGRYQKALCETVQGRPTKDRSLRSEQTVGRKLSSRDRYSAIWESHHGPLSRRCAID